MRQVRERENVCVQPLGFVASQPFGLCWRKWCLKGWELVCDLIFERLWKVTFQGLGGNGVELVLPDTSKQDLAAVINFLYTGQVTIQVKV